MNLTWVSSFLYGSRSHSKLLQGIKFHLGSLFKHLKTSELFFLTVIRFGDHGNYNNGDHGNCNNVNMNKNFKFRSQANFSPQGFWKETNRDYSRTKRLEAGSWKL